MVVTILKAGVLRRLIGAGTGLRWRSWRNSTAHRRRSTRNAASLWASSCPTRRPTRATRWVSWPASARPPARRRSSQILQNRRQVDPGTYVGSGKAIEIAQSAKAFDADFIAFDNELTPGQIGQLEKIVNTHLESPRGAGVKVLDRSEIILDIFANRAQTHEAKLQVELAQMEYTYPRLTKMWGHLERIAGGGTIGVGTRGPGRNSARNRPPTGPQTHQRPQGQHRRGAGPQGPAGREARQRSLHRLPRRLHQCRQIDALQHPHRRRHARRGQAVCHARHQDAGLEAGAWDGGAAAATRSGSSATCRTIWLPASGRPRKRPCTPTCSCTSSTSGTRVPASSTTRSAAS